MVALKFLQSKGKKESGYEEEMARFTGGWIKLHRDLLDKDIGQDLKLLGFFTFLLMAATWEETTVNWQGKPRTIPKGSVVFGYRELAEKFGVSRDTIYRRTTYLRERGTISIESATQGSLITILNYEGYQIDKATDQQPAGHGQDNGPNPNEEVKKLRKNTANLNLRIAEFIGKYCEGFKRRYDRNPVLRGKDKGAAKRLVKDLGLPEALARMEVYLKRNDKFFIDKGHDLITLESNINGIAVKPKDKSQGPAPPATATQPELPRNPKLVGELMQKFRLKRIPTDGGPSDVA